ncbi:MAG: HAD-IA family hydrolase [Candidatus Omnitrophica bacterium]|nr:HAD-IA family hydrolase [Candidatus Omnitrophota bacterium]
MTTARIDILVLDAHGVVLNNPFKSFLGNLASLTGEKVESVQRRWDEEIRTAAWTGKITDPELWVALRGNHSTCPTECQSLLEALYEVGPAAPYLESWGKKTSIWLLSNHRSHWLIPRLRRFDLVKHFDRVLISDEMGVAKPNPKAFAPILEEVDSPKSVLFVDDQSRNVETARELGIVGIDLNQTPYWAKQVEEALNKSNGEG